MNRTLPAWALLLALVLVGVAAPVAAHPLRSTAVLLELRGQAVGGEVQLPLDQLELTLRRGLLEETSTLVARRGEELMRYLGEHLSVQAPDGRAFRVDLLSPEVRRIDGSEFLVVKLSMSPPPGATARALTLRYDAILHRVVTHSVFVYVRSDFEGGVFSAHPELLGVLRYRSTSLGMDRSDGSWWRGFQSVFVLGTRHIAEGTDHLLFLLVLLLAAPLLGAGGRWAPSPSTGHGVKQVVKVVSAFTLGHSLTLAAGALGVLQVPQAPVEILIAVSILVSAVHALRPLFSGREPLIAVAFGLVHGLAFSTVLAEFGLDTRALVLSVLAFNLGIEAMQLAVVAVTLPWLLVLSRSPVHALVRGAGACFAGVAAVGWIAERAFALQTPIVPFVEAIAGHALLGVALLAGLSLAVVGGTRLRARRAGNLLSATMAGPAPGGLGQGVSGGGHA
ncbi:HupE/UreJ family protein [Cystobacter fuscus]|uniref:HupE/UreJ family protein n=1 Tax=Cystobacter fuscus TaxID=43 RepID=UPI002B313A93|nr:HupE/UreJ family protein [Cystobacter fuscus]